MKVVEFDSKKEVKKADVIVRARYKLNPLSLKFITTLITGLKISDDINQEYIFKVKDFKELTKLKRKDLYWAIKEALKELLEKPIFIPNNNGYMMCNWISGGQYMENEGEIKFRIYPDLKPYLLEAQTKFLKYKLENILNLKSSYSIRLYEILKDVFILKNRFNQSTEDFVSMEDFRSILQIPDSYRFFNIKKQILDKAQKELEDNTDIKFYYEKVVKGNKTIGIKFFIEENIKEIHNENILINNNTIDNNVNFETLENFIGFVKSNYSGNMKSFGYKKERWNGEIILCWLQVNKKGMLYSIDEQQNIIDYSKEEEQNIFYNWYQIAKNSIEYSKLLKDKKSFKDVYINEKITIKKIIETFLYLKNEGVL